MFENIKFCGETFFDWAAGGFHIEISGTIAAVKQPECRGGLVMHEHSHTPQRVKWCPSRGPDSGEVLLVPAT